jgi:hypothetical protein
MAGGCDREPRGVAGAGHFLQEDVEERLGAAVARFIQGT